MARQIPTHSVVWAKALLEHLAKTGFDERTVLKGLRVSVTDLQNPEARWSFDKTLSLFERAADLTGDDLWGMHFSQSPNLIQKAGLLAYVGVSAPTLGGYLRNITRFQRVIGDASQSALIEDEHVTRLTWRYSGALTLPTRQYAEFGAIGTLYALRDFTRRELRPTHLRFSHQRRDNIDALRRYAGCPVSFGHDENEIGFKSSDMRLPLVTADDNLQRALTSICENTLAQMPKAPDSITQKAERLITARLASGTAQQDQIAAELGMSPRTMARRLADEGTSFVALVSDLRQALARDYLQNSDLPLTEIAFLLGYSDASSFSTAFRRWYQQSPRSFRKQA